MHPWFVVLTAVLSFAASLVPLNSHNSNSPTPGALKVNQPQDAKSSSSGKPTRDEKQHTDKSPVFVKILPSDNAKEEAAEAEKDREEKTTNDRYIIDLTGILALIGFLQLLVFAFQGYYLKQTVEAAVSSERPYIFPDIPETSDGFLPGPSGYITLPPGWDDAYISCVFANVGRTVGIIREIRGELVLNDLPAAPGFTYSAIMGKEGQIIVRADTQTDAFRFPYSRKLTSDEREKFSKDTLNAYFFGYVIYTDSYGWMHTKGFGFQLGRKVKAQPAGGKAYNYSRSQRTPDKFST